MSERSKARGVSGGGSGTAEEGEGRSLREMRAARGGGSEGLLATKSERQQLVERAIAKYRDDTASKELLEVLVELNYLVDKLAEKDLHGILSDKENKPGVLLAGKIEFKINYDDPAFDAVFEKLKKALSEENK
jgi:hypothetical protein